MSRILIDDGTELVEKLMIAESTFDRMRGLLGRNSLPNNAGLLIRPCRSIHMWFMHFPIDAAFLSSDLRVLKIARNLRPGQLGWAPRQTQCVLETAAGALSSLKIGDQLRMDARATPAP